MEFNTTTLRAKTDAELTALGKALKVKLSLIEDEQIRRATEVRQHEGHAKAPDAVPPPSRPPIGPNEVRRLD
jgi:hypothetical protein